MPKEKRKVDEVKTVEEVIKAIRMELTPPDDKYGAPEVGVFLDNVGWYAYCKGGSIFYDGFILDEPSPSALEACVALLKFFRRN